MEEAENFGYEECVRIYGEPKDIVVAYYENEGDTLLKKIKYKMYIRITVLVIIIVAIATRFAIFKAYLDARDTIPDRVEIIVGEG